MGDIRVREQAAQVDLVAADLHGVAYKQAAQEPLVKDQQVEVVVI
jgi:hypothetical protein